MRFALLGPLTATGPAGEQLTVPGPRQRVLLAVLLLHANRPVPADTLAELVWDGRPPADGRGLQARTIPTPFGPGRVTGERGGPPADIADRMASKAFRGIGTSLASPDARK